MSLPFNLAFSGLSSGLQTKNAATAWDYNHTFTTDDGKWSFSTPSASNEVNTASGKLLFNTTASNTGGANISLSGDVFNGVVSDTAWVLEYHKIKFITKTAYVSWYNGMSAVDHTISSYTTNGFNNGSGDWEYFYIYHDGTDYTRLGWTSGGNNGAGDNTSDTTTWATGVDKYLQLIRTSATSSSGKWGSTSNFASPTVSLTNTTMPSTIDSLRYVKIGNLIYTGFGGACTGSIETVKFANGVTTAPP